MMELLRTMPAVDRNLYSEIYRAKGLQALPQSPVVQAEMIRSDRLSDAGGANIWLASDLSQEAKTHKIRGAYNLISQSDFGDTETQFVTAGDGNHASAVAQCARDLVKRAVIYVPTNTPTDKVERAKKLGGDSINIRLEGESFEDTFGLAQDYGNRHELPFIHPFDDELVIAGNGTLGIEIADKIGNVDAVYCPVGGGSLLSGVGTIIRMNNPEVELVGVELNGAPSLKYAHKKGAPTPLPHIDNTYIDGAVTKQVGNRTYGYLKDLKIRTVSVKNTPLRRAITNLWSDRKNPVRCDLAGGLAVAAVEQELGCLAGKTVVCIVSGGNLSIDRYRNEVRLD